jgi:eukaryotic-like serine/threonine-protein kinase
VATDQWPRVKAIFQSALERAPQERTAFVRDVCGEDEEVRREVESLLLAHQEAGHFAGSGLGIRDLEFDLIGREIGAYQILSLLGAGGMGEVYRARDTKLGREVAIKTLPSTFTSNTERRARFEREARVLATLNHPHIGAIYGLEHADGVQALVLELVEGETLAERLVNGPLSISAGLAIGRQIADALNAAHEKGIVHRDLKPANIKITPNGTVKVLDFGLAKATGPNLPHSPTITVDATRDGTVLGTAAYMSPEQARGQPVDKRTDIWAFGCVLYEMLTGRPVFDRATFSDTVAAIIEREPDWSALPANLSPTLNIYLRRCLQRDPRERIHDIADVRLALEGAFDGPLRDSNHSLRRYRSLTAIAAIVLSGVAASTATLYLRRSVPAPVLTRFEIPTPPTSDPVSFALSADGRQLAFVATSDGAPRLWVRPLDQVTAQPLAGTEGANYPFWAPDGRAIGFFAGGKLKRIDLGSGGLLELSNAPSGRGGTWSRDDVLVFAPDRSGALMRVLATGGTPVSVTRLAPGQGTHRWPQFLPDGRHFLFFVGFLGSDAQGVYVGTLDAGGEPKRVLDVATAAVYAPPGALLWVYQGVLVAQRFDAESEVVSGEPIPVAQAVGSDDALQRGAFAVSATGVLAHRAGRGEWRQLTWVDRAGVIRGTVGPPDENALSSPELAPNGRRVAVTRMVEGNQDVWLVDTDRDQQSRLTFDASLETLPLWSPDGSRVVFASVRELFPNVASVLFEKAASGAGDEQPLPVTGEPKTPLAWSSDGQFLLYGILHPKTAADLWALPMAGDRTPLLVLQTRFDETSGQFSPDGRWVAYQSNDSGPFQIYVRPFRGPGGPWQVSTAGGSQPRWRPDGKELFYVAADARLMAVPITVAVDQQTLTPGAPVPLFRTRLASGASINPSRGGVKPQYAVASDGRFLMNVSVEGATAQPITVVLNWDAALKR